MIRQVVKARRLVRNSTEIVSAIGQAIRHAALRLCIQDRTTGGHLTNQNTGATSLQFARNFSRPASNRGLVQRQARDEPLEPSR